jgi:hypothetical protein
VDHKEHEKDMHPPHHYYLCPQHTDKPQVVIEWSRSSRLYSTVEDVGKREDSVVWAVWDMPFLLCWKMEDGGWTDLNIFRKRGTVTLTLRPIYILKNVYIYDP